MAEMLIECTACHRKYQADPRIAGKQVRCKHCGSIFQVPPLNSGEAGNASGPDELADLAALASLEDEGNPQGVDTDIRITHPTAPAGSQLTGGYSRMERTRQTEGYDLASDLPFDDRRPNTPFVYAGSREVDDWLPWVLIVGGLLGTAWTLFNWGVDRPLWMNLLRAAVYVILFLAIIHPLTRLGLGKGMNRARVRSPGGMGVRAMGIYVLPLFIGTLLWTAGSDIRGLIVGIVVGLVLSMLAMWLLLRLNPTELAPVGISGSAAFLAGAAIIVGLILLANLATLASIRSKEMLAEVTVSPLGETLPWEAAPAPAPPRPAKPSPPAPAHASVPPTTSPVVDEPTPPSDSPTIEQAEVTPPEKTAPIADGTETKTPAAATTAPSTTPKITAALPAETPAESKPEPFKPATPIIQSIRPLDALGGFAEVIHPQTASNYLAVIRDRGQNRDSDTIETWSLNPPARASTAQFNHARDKIDQYILSPDGDLLARIVTWPKPSVQIWSFSRQNILQTVGLNDQLGQPALLGFANARQFAVLWTRGGAVGMEYFDAFTGRSLRQINLTSTQRDANSFAFDPNGNFIATPGTLNQEPVIALYAFPSGQITAQFKLKDLDPRRPVDPAGMAFSPDGGRLAVLFEQDGNGLLLSWDVVNYARPPVRHLDPNGFGYSAADRTVQTAIQWLDTGAWLLWGRAIYDTETGKPLGQIGTEGVIDQHLIQPGWMQLTVGDEKGSGRHLLDVRVDAQQLAAAKEAAAR